MKHTPLPARSRGVTLIEALVALLILVSGMVALVELTASLRRSGDLGKQRSEATRIAQADLATLRSFSMRTRPTGAAAKPRDYDADIASLGSPLAVTPEDSNTSYQVDRTVTSFGTDPSEPEAKAVQVIVSWRDRSTRSLLQGQEGPQQVVLNSVVARVDPSFAGAVALAPAPGEVRPPAGRHPAVPVGAKDLGNQTSAFRPSRQSSAVWVFSNLTGFITGVCSIPPGTPVSTLAPGDVEACSNGTVGYLLSGVIRFSNTEPANPTAPEAGAIPLGLGLATGTYLAPRLDARGAPVKDSHGAVVMDTLTATPPAHQCFNDSPGSAASAQPFVTYACIVYPDLGSSPRFWSGTLVLTGFNLGTTASGYRVCRYSADYNGDGSVAGNFEHPDVYVKVANSLPRQNFLVVRGDRACPRAPAVDPTSGVFVDYSTAQLQPAP